MSRILVTGVGGAAGIAAVTHLKKKGHFVLGVDCKEYSPGFLLADEQALVPCACARNYISQLFFICIKNKIEIMIPTVDEELIICSENKEFFGSHGITILVSNVDTIENCLNKYKFYEKMKENNIAVARTWVLNDTLKVERIPLPVIAKPITGRGGRGIIIVRTRAELVKLMHERNHYIIQEFFNGIEYSVDTLSDLNGKAIVAVPRKRLEIKSGVCSRGCTDQHKGIIVESMRAVEAVGMIGPACLQLILTENGEIKIFELNPRIGGTVSLSIHAGVDILNLTIKLLKNETITEEELIFHKKYISRYFSEVFFDIE